MRGPSADEILNTNPPALRSNKTTTAYLELRKRILTGGYKPNQTITPKEIDDEYKLSNTSTQVVLLRLANEGLIKVSPVKARTWPNNAALNEYRVADLNVSHRMMSTRHGGFVSDLAQQGHHPFLEILVLKVQYADQEIASLLNISPGEKVIFYRTLQRSDANTVVAISDTYLPFWFSEVLPELEKPDCDIYQLMIHLGKNPVWCTETVDITQATSIERMLFELSSDDPSALLKILRRVFDHQGNPLNVDYLTDRGDMYRLQYSFPLFVDGIPEALRKK